MKRMIVATVAIAVSAVVTFGDETRDHGHVYEITSWADLFIAVQGFREEVASRVADFDSELSKYPDMAIQHTPMEVLAIQVLDPLEGEDDASADYNRRIATWFLQGHDEVISSEVRLVNIEIVSMDDFEAIDQSGTLMHAAISIPDHYDPAWTLTLLRVRSDSERRILLRALLVTTRTDEETDSVYSVSKTFEFEGEELEEIDSDFTQILQ